MFNFFDSMGKTVDNDLPLGSPDLTDAKKILKFTLYFLGSLHGCL